MKKYLPLFVLLYSTFCQAQKINFLGLTHSGGGIDSGTVFVFNAITYKENILHGFGDITSGTYPYGSLIKASNGLYYGTTSDGGAYNMGTIFSYNDSLKILTDIYNFGGTITDGENPFSSLLQVGDSMLYGVTAYGGTSGIYGTIFSYNLFTGIEIDLYDFGNSSHGQFPYGSLIKANNGLLYGMAGYGGTDDGGLIFSYNISTNTEEDVYDFSLNYNDGYNPYGSLIQANNGLLYGLTTAGGDTAGKEGAIFSYDMSNSVETPLHYFKNDASDGGYPYGSLLQASDGLLYGLTQKGGMYDYGVIFNFNITTGLEKKLYDFGNGTDGQYPYNSLIQASNGLLYGTTEKGGFYGEGTIFNYNVNSGSEQDIFDFNGANGSLPLGNLIEDDSANASISLLEIPNFAPAIFPIPSTGVINIIAQNNIDALRITNLLGQTIYTSTPNQNRITFDLNVEAGMYFINLTSGNQIETKKIIIQR